MKNRDAQEDDEAEHLDELHQGMHKLALDGTCDIVRRIAWPEEQQQDNEDDILRSSSIAWDKAAFERCLGWPIDLIDSTFEWWLNKIHPEDRQRVIASFKRSLFESDTARYWSESYRLRAYDGEAAAPAPSSSTSTPSFFDVQGSGGGDAEQREEEQLQEQEQAGEGEEQEEEEEDTPQQMNPDSNSTSHLSLHPYSSVYESTHSPASESTETLHEEGRGTRHHQDHASSLSERAGGGGEARGAEARARARGDQSQRRQGTITPSSSYNAAPPLATSSALSSNPSSYVTVLDQVYITRQSPSSEQEKEKGMEGGDDNGTSLMEQGAVIASASTTTPSTVNPSRPRSRPHSRPIHAIGSIFALEQKVKTSEALHNPRSQLLRNISGISTTSTTSTNASAATGSGSSASFASASSSIGVGYGSPAAAFHYGGTFSPPPSFQTTTTTPIRPPIYAMGSASGSFTSTSGGSAAGGYPHSPSSYSPGTGKAFSFLDVEGVRTVLENTQSGLIMVDQYSRPTYLNTAGAAMTGFQSLEDIRSTGKTLHGVLHHKRVDGSDYPTDDCPILKSIATLTRETNHPDTFWRKDGTPFPVMWSCSPISKLGRPIGAVLEFRDVTEEKALENDKLKAILMTKHQEITIKEANASKQRMTQFLDYIAHELRNPLHGIAANIEFLRDSLTALQATFTNERPHLSPLQPTRDSTTPTASISGLSTGSQSSLFNSSSAGSSASSLSAAGVMRARSPQVAIPSPSAITSAALSSAIVPARDLSPPKAEITSTLGSPSRHETSPLLVGSSSGLSTSPGKVSGVAKANVGDGGSQSLLSGAAASTATRPSLPAFEGSLTGPGVKRLDEHISQLSSILPHAGNHPGTPKHRVGGSSASDEQVNKQFSSHFERTPGDAGALPPWQAEDKKSEHAHMTMSPLLADITKHTQTPSATTSHVSASTRKESHPLSAQPSQGPATASPLNPATLSSAMQQEKRSTSHDRLRDEELQKRLPPASPSPSATTVVASEADTENPRLSNLEVQQVLQTSQSFITSIRECVFHATHITNNVLDLSRFEAGKVELLNDIVFPARVATLAVDMMMARAQEKDIELGLDIPQDQTLVRGDGTRLAQVFLNLLSNAIKFTPRGGKVTLRFRMSFEGSRVMLTGAISDTGMGMSKAEMSNLFQRFGQSSRAIQAEYGGTGLGLSICQEIVTLQGGKMSVDSEKGKGSTFSFTAYYQPASEDDVNEYLRKTPGQSRRGSISPTPSPTSESSSATNKAAVGAFIPTITASITGQTSIASLPEAQQARLNELKKQFEAEQAEQEPFKFKHILVAEDNGINQNIMKTYLKKLGYNFTIVSNGQEVLDTFVNKPQEVPIDVILMDCEMPVMDGRQATEHIRQHEHFRKNLVTPLDSPFNLQLGAVEINSLQSTPPTGTPTISHYSPPLTSPALSHTSSPGIARKLHRTPIIGLSGNARQELVQQALSSGMDDYVVKPFKLAELEKVLKKWEATIDEQLIHRSIAIKAKEFMAANAAAISSPLKSKRLGSSSSDEFQFPWASSGKTGSASIRSDSSSSDGMPRSPTKSTSGRPIRPPLVSSMSASRLPREHLIGYSGSSERSRPKLPSRLSNEWIQQASKTRADKMNTDGSPNVEPQKLSASTGPSQSAPTGMSPVIESPSPSPQPDAPVPTTTRAFPLPIIRPNLNSRRSTSDPSVDNFRRSL